jgi:hypothetical protein
VGPDPVDLREEHHVHASVREFCQRALKELTNQRSGIIRVETRAASGVSCLRVFAVWLEPKVVPPCLEVSLNGHIVNFHPNVVAHLLVWATSDMKINTLPDPGQEGRAMYCVDRIDKTAPISEHRAVARRQLPDGYFIGQRL